MVLKKYVAVVTTNKGRIFPVKSFNDYDSACDYLYNVFADEFGYVNLEDELNLPFDEHIIGAFPYSGFWMPKLAAGVGWNF